MSVAKLKDRRSGNPLPTNYRQKLEPPSSNSSSKYPASSPNSSRYTCTSKIRLDSRKGSDGRRSSTCQCHKFVMDSASRDVPSQKSRLRSKESVFGPKDKNVPRREFLEECYKSTKPRNLKPAFEYFREDGSSLDLSHDPEFSRISRPSRDDGGSDGDRLSRRQGTRRRTRTVEGTTLREKMKRTPETLAYLCVRVIVENVMWCEENHIVCELPKDFFFQLQNIERNRIRRISKLLLLLIYRRFIFYLEECIFFLFVDVCFFNQELD